MFLPEISISCVLILVHFRGQEDGYVDLYYFGAWWYDPELGRWLSPEPLGLDGHLNVSLTQTTYGGGYGGLNYGWGISGTLTNADCVFQLKGRGTKTGFDSPYGGAGWVTNPNRDYDGFTISGPTPKIGVYGFVSGTNTYWSANPYKAAFDYYYGIERSIRKIYGY